ncbi:MAG: hypothetical protein KDI98_11020, partial [Hyphomicrobiaceae bacterium]|nr:hypothetical protein [Hyphomicrobiaceae bacterium]
AGGKLDEVASDYDDNGDGTISLVEARDALKELGDSEGKTTVERAEQMAKLYEDYDADGNGSLSEEEFQAYLDARGSEEAGETEDTGETDETEETDGEVKPCDFDGDNSGTLDGAEMEEFLTAAGVLTDDMSEVEKAEVVADFMALADADTSGEVSLEEAANALELYNDAKGINANGDGNIDVAEWIQFATDEGISLPDGFEAQTELLNKLNDKADADGNGDTSVFELASFLGKVRGADADKDGQISEEELNSVLNS